MNFQEYQKRAMSSEPNDLPAIEGLKAATLGLAGEAGEVVDAVKKQLYHPHKKIPHDVFVSQVREELGDVLWYVAWMCDRLGIELEAVAATNIEKLASRYPNGFPTQQGT